MHSELKNLFSEICQGYTKITFRGKNLYFKHPTILDRSSVDEFYDGILKKNLDMGLSPRSQILKEAYESGAWSVEKEKDITNKKLFYERSLSSRKNAKSPAAAESLSEALVLMEKELFPMLEEKESLFRESAEDLANEESLEMQIYYFSFSDPRFENQFFSEDDYSYLKIDSIKEFYELRNAFVDSVNKMNDKSIRLLVIQYFFQNILSIYKETLSLFFNKPAYQLTEFQITLLNWGVYFSNVIDLCNDLENDKRDNPDYLEAYAIAKRNKK